MAHPKTSQHSSTIDTQRQARLLMGKQVICLFLILALVMIPFISIDYYYSEMAKCKQQKSTTASISFSIGTWLKVKAFSDLAYLAWILLTAIIILATQNYPCFLSIYGYYLFFLGLFRLSWMIVGSVIFWGSIFKRNVCTTGENAYIWIDLILGYVTVVVNMLTTKSPAE